MTPKEKILYMALVPLMAAGIGASATLLAQDDSPRIVLTGAAVEAARGNVIKVEVTNETKSDVLKPLAPVAMLGGLSLMLWAMSKWN